jgi:hypothetical protein
MINVTFWQINFIFLTKRGNLTGIYCTEPFSTGSIASSMKVYLHWQSLLLKTATIRTSTAKVDFYDHAVYFGKISSLDL